MKIWKPEDPLPGPGVFEDEEPYDKSWIFEDPQSEEIIRQVGFDERKAAKSWRRWSEWAEEGGAEFGCATRDVPFLALVKGVVEFSDDAWGDDDAVWIQWMQKHGISAELQDAIMDPTFKQVRLTRTCEQWVLDTIDMRYETFYNKRTKSECEGNENSQDTEHEYYDGAVVPEETPGMTVLYKAIVLNRRRNTPYSIFDSEGRLAIMNHLVKYQTIVFGRSGSLIYLGTSLKATQLHASYLRRLSNGLDTNVVIVQLHIPDIALQDTSVPIYFPSDNWKKLVWYYQNRAEDKELRDEISWLCRAQVIVGHLTSRPKEVLSQLGSWEDLTEKHVLNLDGNADGDIHYAFRDDGGEDFLEDNVTDGKITSFSKEQYLEWMEKHEAPSQGNIVRSLLGVC
ncbi:hypothetical protein NW768_006843 [Fusarium equiseti]|uniref:Uncharacterized protein n=1 Tax=Fusarium equiseti TaxID=61235 RepID=A0ABQ8R9B8_FUSEQ|nr:hypothetical protein NW768_006843 [Fusarium equiseti]